jgi:hypothetical protein
MAAALSGLSSDWPEAKVTRSPETVGAALVADFSDTGGGGGADSAPGGAGAMGVIKAVCGTVCGSAGGATGADGEDAADPDAAAEAVEAASDGGFFVEAASAEALPGAELSDRGVTVCVRPA